MISEEDWWDSGRILRLKDAGKWEVLNCKTQHGKAEAFLKIWNKNF